jgi:hypothetical protein
VEADALDLVENLRGYLPGPVQKEGIARTKCSNVFERQLLPLPHVVPLPLKLTQNLAEHTAMPGFASSHDIALGRLRHFAVRT